MSSCSRSTNARMRDSIGTALSAVRDPSRHSTSALMISVRSASNVSSEATAKAPTKWYSLYSTRPAAASWWSARGCARDHRDGAELAHRARVAEDHAVKQTPADVRQRHAEKYRPAARAEPERRFLLVACRAAASAESARAPRNGKVTNSVASTMPGTAKMIWMSCSCSHGPNQPCAPNSSTKTRPAMTGETANGRSISVISGSCPGSRTWRSPMRRRCRRRVDRHDDRGGEQGEADRRQRVGLA